MNVPGYWMNETSGVLRPAVIAYLNGEPMTREHITAMRAYLKQWIDADWKGGEELEALRLRVRGLYTRQAIHDWLKAAAALEIDPL